MKKLLLILLYLPMMGFGQDDKIEKSKFNFNKSNNYNTLEKKLIPNQYYISPSIFDSKKPIKKNNDTISNYILHSKSKSSFYPFNKGLIHIISEAMQKGSNDKSFTLKKQEEKPQNQLTID